MTNANVLVVDDDQEMSELVSVGLRRRGFVATACTSADAALAALDERPFEVVVTDMHMRGMSGIGLAERVLARHPDIPVVVMTAFGSLETAVAAMRAGAMDFVTKPFELDVLVESVERALDERARRKRLLADQDLVSLDEIERRYIARVMDAVAGNKVHAARLLGMDRTTLYRKLDRYGLLPSGSE